MMSASQTLRTIWQHHQEVISPVAPVAAAPFNDHPIWSGPITAPGIRRLRQSDIPQICDLFAATFRPGKSINREALAQSFIDTYLTSPLDRDQPASLVDVDASGRVLGFMGMITLSARLGERSLRGGICGSYMALDSSRAKTGLRLARFLKTHDLDFVFTDTASDKSTNLLRLMAFESIGLPSLEWIKCLRPFGTVGYLAGRRVPIFRPIFRAMARPADFLASHLPFARLTTNESEGVVDTPISEADFLAVAPALTRRYEFAPDWTGDDLPWIISQARLKTRNGPLHLRQVRDPKGKLLGLYLAYMEAGNVAQVLQVLPEPNQDGPVIDSLFRFAASLGAIAVKGAAGHHIADGLRRQSGIFYHQVSTNIAFARDPDVMKALHTHKALIGGLLGETWCRLITDEFKK